MGLIKMVSRKLRLIWIFYKKLLLPVVLVTVVASFFLQPVTGDFNFQVNFIQIGIAFFVISLIMQLIIYELRNPDEYYFYYNLGLSKKQLWVINALISLVVCVLLSSIQFLS